MELMKARLSGLKDYAPHIIKYTLFIISAIYTVLLFRSQASTEFSKILQSVLGVILELSKYTLPVVAVVGMIAGKQINWGLRGIALILAVACFYYSIMATQGFQLIELLQIKQINIENSDDYKRLKSQLDTKEAQLKTANTNSSKLIDLDKSSKSDNTKLINQLNSDNTALQKQKSSKNTELQQAINKKQLKTQARLNSEIKQIQSSIDNNYTQLKGLKSSDILQSNNNNINTLNTDIKALNQQIDALKTTSKTKEGYDVLFENQKDLNEFIFWLAILIELIGIFFAIIVGINAKNKIRKITTIYYDDEVSDTTELKDNTENQPKEITEPKDQDAVVCNKDIGFKYQKTADDNNASILDTRIIGKYKDYMIKTSVQKDDKLISKGHKHISENIGVDIETGRKIKGHLEQTGIIETIGNRTYIQKSST